MRLTVNNGQCMRDYPTWLSGNHDPGGPFQGPHKLHMKENL